MDVLGEDLGGEAEGPDQALRLQHVDPMASRSAKVGRKLVDRAEPFRHEWSRPLPGFGLQPGHPVAEVVDLLPDAVDRSASASPRWTIAVSQVAHLVAQVLEVPGGEPLDDGLGRLGARARPSASGRVDIDPGLLGDEGQRTRHVERRGERVEAPDRRPDPRRIGGGEAGSRLELGDRRSSPPPAGRSSVRSSRRCCSQPASSSSDAPSLAQDLL